MSVIKYDDLSEESKEMLAKTGKKGENYKAKKLVNDFKYVKNYKIDFLILLVIKNIFHRPRIKYLTHMANLQFYLSKGLVLRKIHTLIKFKQEDFASNFIKMTTTLRKNAVTNFDKAFWKFVNNVLFGKSMEGKSTKFLA